MVLTAGLVAVVGVSHGMVYETTRQFQVAVALASVMFAAGLIKLGGERNG